MSEQELILSVKELHVLSLTCSHCGHGTTFDFKSSDCLEESVSQCSICKTELAVDLQEQLKAYRCFYDSMSKCDRLEFRVRLNNPEAAASAAASESASEVREVVSTAVAEVQEAVATALAKEHGMANLVGGPFRGFGAKP